MTRYPATLLLGVVLLVTLTGCDDPQHGAYHVKGIWTSLLLLVLGLMFGFISYRFTRRCLAVRRHNRIFR